MTAKRQVAAFLAGLVASMGSTFDLGSAAIAAEPATPPATRPVLTEAEYAAQFPEISIAPGPFSAKEESFKQYQYPEWFRDAKLGIWAHWGPQAVPMEGDWYAKRMYEQGDKDYADHLKRFGHPSKTGYKDIIPMWKAEKWDPDALMELYKKAGAKYFVAQAVHHDNFDNWNSKYHRWNSVNMGPHRDVVGDWQKAAVKQGLRFGVSEHLGASFTWFQASHGSDKSGPMAGVLYDGADLQFADLYHYPRAADDKGWYSKNPLWQKEWHARIKDLVDQYHPELLYSDGGVAFNNDTGRSIIAHLYNSSAATNNGVTQAVYNCKQHSNGMWVEDVERGVLAGISPHAWQTDTSIGDWFYNKHWKYRSAEWVIHSLVDIVSKNGNLLINVVQRPDGSLDDEAVKIVQDLSQWMTINGEGIYDTRPWLVFGEGKTHFRGGSFNENYKYTADDVRFTCKGDTTLYAFALGWPADHKLTIRSLGKVDGVTAKITRVSLLGSAAELKWTHDAGGLNVELPENKPSDFAIGLKIEGTDLKGFKPEVAAPQSLGIKADASGVFTLLPETAECKGVVNVETKHGQSNLGNWDSASDTVNWVVVSPPAGSYRVTASYSATADSALFTQVGESRTKTPVQSTGSWTDYKEITLGNATVTKPGDISIAVGAADPQNWHPVNLRWIKLTRTGD